MPENISYDNSYFTEAIFDTDYKALASAVVEIYHPQSVIDVGCGPGKLSLELDGLGVTVTAVDGFSKPDFKNSIIRFDRVDLNNPMALLQFIGERKYDAAICIEVAEHLSPSVSSALITGLATAAPVVIFSSAVPDQGGYGHINLRPREFWHREFSQKNYLCADRIRPHLRGKESIAPWYQLNILDYVRADHPLAPRSEDVIERLIAAESHSTSSLFRVLDELAHAKARLRQFPMNWALALRLFAKRFRGR